MSRILVGSHDGVYLLKFEGDVRLTLGPATERYIGRIVSDPGFRGVLVDLTQTQLIDSTSLGLLARLSIRVSESYGVVPTLVCTSNDILKILHTMGFDEIFHITASAPCRVEDLGELPKVDVPQHELREIVINAHKTLMDMNSQNLESFQDLIQELEADGQAKGHGSWLGASPG